MARYLYPCPDCKKSFPVGTRHAGQSIPCNHCQSAIEIPKLGELRNFPEEKEDLSNSGRNSGQGHTRGGHSTSRTRNWLFSGGLMVAVLSAAAGFALLKYSQGLYNDVGEYSDYRQELSTEQISEMEPAEMWDWWNRAIEVELGEWQEHPGVGSNIQSEILAKVAYGLFALAAFGLLILLSSFAIGKK